MFIELTSLTRTILGLMLLPEVQTMPWCNPRQLPSQAAAQFYSREEMASRKHFMLILPEKEIKP